MLRQEEIDFYHAQGYLGLDGVLSAAEVDGLRRVTDEFVDKSRQVREHDAAFDLEPGHTPEAPRLRRLKNPIDHHPVYDQTLRHGAILDIVAPLIGPDIRTNGTKLNMKSAAFGSPVEWHQDWAFYPHTNDDLLAVGVALDDMTLDTGCLLLLPGSHRGPVYDHHQDGVFVGAVTEPDFQPQGAVPITVKAGGITLHHVRALHGSAPNTSAQPRRLLLLQYCARDAWPLSGVPDWDTFNRYSLRGQPANQPRLAPVPVRIPLPHAERKGSICEVQSVFDRPLFERVAG